MPVALVLAGLLAGCGVPVEDRPRQVQPPRGPYPALASAAPFVDSGTARERLCFVRDNRLVPVVRRVPELPTVDGQLRQLVAGPSPAERDDALTSALTGTNLLSVTRLPSGEAVVDVGASPEGLGRSDEVLAFGQIVCTLTSRPDVSMVSFRRDGRQLGIPRADGSLSSGPLTMADYGELVDRD